MPKNLSKTSSSGPKSPDSGQNPSPARQRNFGYASSPGTNSDSGSGNSGLEERSWIGSKRPKETKLQKYYPWLLVVGGAIGLYAAFALMQDKIAVIRDPSYVPNCDVNPIIACGSVISTDQASAFNFPNPILGLVGFMAVIVVGASLFANRKFVTKIWYWRTFWAGTVFGVGFIHWLFFQSVYRIGALCPYCMVVWAVTMPIFWYTTLYMLREGYLSLPKGWGKVGDFMQRNHAGILLSWYLVIAGLILNRFWYFFGW